MEKDIARMQGEKRRAYGMVPTDGPESARRWRGFNVALKPSYEPIVCARKPLSEPSVARNVLRWGTGAINVDGCRIEGVPQPKFNSPTGRVYQMKTGEGRNGEMSQSTQGRWPPNLLLSHAEGCVRLGERRVKGSKLDHVCTSESKNGIYQPMNPKHKNGHTDPDGYETVEAWECQEDCPVRAMGEHARFFPNFTPDVGPGFLYAPKASRAERNAGLEGMPEKQHHSTQRTEVLVCKCGNKTLGDSWPKCSSCGADMRDGTRMRRNGLTAANNHPTVKPIALMRWLVRLITPPGGRILDPFCGSGSTLVAAVLEGFEAVGVEKEAEYATIARRRVEWARRQRF